MRQLARLIHAPHTMQPGKFSGELLLGRYHLGNKVGEGGVSEVYLAQDKREMQSGHTVAVKVLNTSGPAGSRNSALTRFFMQEMDFISRFRHAGLPRYLGGGDLSGNPFFVVPYVDAPTLRDVLDSHQSEVSFHAKSIALQLCTLLSHVHAAGVLHLDVKSNNIFLSTAGRKLMAQLFDFGISWPTIDAGHYHTPNGILCTPEYMAPERIASAHRSISIGPQTDIYSMGILLHELLVGATPFSHENPLELMLMHVNCPIPFVEAQFPELHIHPDISAVIVRALQKRPSDRFQTMDEMAAAIRDAKFHIKIRASFAAERSSQNKWHPKSLLGLLGIPNHEPRTSQD